MRKFQEETTYESGMDENFKSTAVNAAHDALNSQDRRNDHHASYVEMMRHNQVKIQSLELAEREMALTERRNREQERAQLVANREFSTHALNLQVANLGESLKTALVDALSETVTAK